jgi:hypothetical protein
MQSFALVTVNPSDCVSFEFTIAYAIYRNAILNMPMKTSLVVLRILFSE